MRAYLLPLLVAGLIAGCGGDDDETTQTSGGAEATATSESSPDASATDGSAGGEAVEVEMKNIQYDPQSITVQVGQRILWVNEDDVQHDADATSGADFDTDLVGKGGTVEWTAEEPGTVEYICSVHPNMTGTITVE